MPIRVVLWITCLLLGTPLHAQVEDSHPAGTSQLTLDDLRTFTDVFNLVRQNYVDEISDHELMVKALNGMLDGLDGHTQYMAPDAFQDQDNFNRGRYAGIGVNIQEEDRRIVIREVNPNGPAFAAGIKAGDIITAVDGNTVRGRSIEESIEQLSGPPGSEVVVQVRSGQDPLRSITLTRQFLDIASVHSRLLEGDFGYLEISHFHLRSDAEFQRELEHLQAVSAAGLQGLVIDLRGNPGGVVQPAMAIADGFLESGLIVTTDGRNADARRSYAAQPGQWYPGLPLVVLVNRQTASSSEILAGALQDHGRAVLVGETTYGKGTVQSVLELRNGGALRLTTARYNTPSGRIIDHEGIEPDVIAGPGHLAHESSEKASSSAATLLPDAPINQMLADANPESDSALAQALDILRNGGTVAR